ncbi:ROK family transcriptional regulator [Microbacterium deminutum]|uniref:ROK family transcriptional regulator n=1 Tax=Microbacterium deminutum TaxID=344164 RepID=A0ABP5BFR7_9MICO
MAGASIGLASADVRRHNLSLVLRHLAGAGPTSRTAIAEQTGLTRGSVTALVQILQEAGIVRETTSVVGLKGRPRTNLALAGDAIALLALQIASDEVIGMLTSLVGDEVATISRPHAASPGDPGPVLDLASQVMRELIDVAAAEGRTVRDASIVVLAPVGGDPPRVIGDAALGWRAVDVVGGIRDRLPELGTVPVTLASDAPVAATAELRRLGVIADAIYLKGDSTIGGALVINGEVVSGAHSFAGSLGHLAVVPDGEVCVCGQRGCLVTVAGIAPLAAAAGMDADFAAHSPHAALAEFIARVDDGDAAAGRAWAGALPWIGRTIAILSMAVDPSVVVIGGQWAPLASTIEDAFRRARPDVADDDEKRARVVPGVLGSGAALRGAIEAGQQRLLRDPQELLYFNT